MEASLQPRHGHLRLLELYYYYSVSTKQCSPSRKFLIHTTKIYINIFTQEYQYRSRIYCKKNKKMFSEKMKTSNTLYLYKLYTEESSSSIYDETLKTHVIVCIKSLHCRRWLKIKYVTLINRYDLKPSQICDWLIANKSIIKEVF